MKIFRITSELSSNFKSGYTGNRFFSYPQFGHTSKVEAQSALCDFTNGYQFTKTLDYAPLPFYHTSLDGERAGNEIYPRSTGLVPSYKGHVPGMQHRYEQGVLNVGVYLKIMSSVGCICLGASFVFKYLVESFPKFLCLNNYFIFFM